MKCPKCNQEIEINEIKNKLSKEISNIDWKEIILKCANISTVGAEDIANTVKDKFNEIVNKIY